jgi:hypothetical protein
MWTKNKSGSSAPSFSLLFPHQQRSKKWTTNLLAKILQLGIISFFKQKRDLFISCNPRSFEGYPAQGHAHIVIVVFPAQKSCLQESFFVWLS